MLAFAPDYDHLPLIAKVEVFEHALQNTEGNDLNKVKKLITFYIIKLTLFLKLYKSLMKYINLVGTVA